MKNLLFIALLLFVTLAAIGQKPVVTDKSGNYVSAVKDTTVGGSKLTGKFFVDTKGIKYPVYESVNGKLFYYKTAKTSGNTYKVYIKVK